MENIESKYFFLITKILAIIMILSDRAPHFRQNSYKIQPDRPSGLGDSKFTTGTRNLLSSEPLGLSGCILYEFCRKWGARSDKIIIIANFLVIKKNIFIQCFPLKLVFLTMMGLTT
jgi:hypothetical protein